jgi:hypothetical protein
MHKICKWKRLKKVEEIQPRVVKGVHYTSIATIYAKHACMPEK